MIVNQVLDELGISLDHELGDITPGLEKPHIASTNAPVCVCVWRGGGGVLEKGRDLGA